MKRTRFSRPLRRPLSWLGRNAIPCSGPAADLGLHVEPRFSSGDRQMRQQVAMLASTPFGLIPGAPLPLLRCRGSGADNERMSPFAASRTTGGAVRKKCTREGATATAVRSSLESIYWKIRHNSRCFRSFGPRTNLLA